jgi:hypothetical protein
MSCSNNSLKIVFHESFWKWNSSGAGCLQRGDNQLSPDWQKSELKNAKATKALAMFFQENGSRCRGVYKTRQSGSCSSSLVTSPGCHLDSATSWRIYSSNCLSKGESSFIQIPVLCLSFLGCTHKASCKFGRQGLTRVVDKIIELQPSAKQQRSRQYGSLDNYISRNRNESVRDLLRAVL